MKIRFVLGPYGYEVVLGNISEQVYNKYSQDNDALRDAVTGFEEDPEIAQIGTLEEAQEEIGEREESVTLTMNISLAVKNYFNIINKNIYPADKQDLKVDDDKGSAMGALGLKPKIVH